MKANSGNLLKAITLLIQFINDHSALLTSKGQNPAFLTASLAAMHAAVSAKEGAQENAKASLRDATIALEYEVNGQYPAFSSTIDLVVGAVGNNTPAGKQAKKLRKLVRSGGGGNNNTSSSTSGSGGSSSSSGGGSSSSSSASGGSSSSSSSS